MFNISIPQPCLQDWEKMTPCTDGRFCNVCNKTVVDFTVMTDDQVKNYFLAAGAMKPCGRFNNNQLTPVTIDIPANIFSVRMPIWKKFLAAAFIVFSSTLFSCNTNVNLSGGTVGEMYIHDTTKPTKHNPKPVGKIKQIPDTLKKVECQPTMGVPMMPVDVKDKTKK